MKSGQFVKGMIGGIEVDPYETSNLSQVKSNLSSSEWNACWDKERIGTYLWVNAETRSIIKTVISKAVPDELGRDGIVNHTVIYQFDSIAQVDGLNYQFPKEQFRQNANMGKYNFPMPPTPELKRPLEYPPALEVAP